ncbi:MAG: methylenetetrahydrofolate reductase [NAD(P)H] [Alphaproteobacteria bacterium]|nr:MAG: methylenetetrahydrofolate reductase [NAD(P)H] [Alphaproteobacteria bacterium]
MTKSMNWFDRRSAPITASFEFFPPKTEEMERTLWASIERLAPLNPSFVSVTYGAGGSTRERTHATVERILKETNLKPAAHLTCVNASKRDVDEILEDYWEMGVRRIVALRGDPAGGLDAAFEAFPDGYHSSVDLIKGIKAIGDFEVSVSAYPEIHPEGRGGNSDLDWLKAKIDAGADQAITQFFFEPEIYLAFLERVRAAGISIPIIPGIMPVTNFNSLTKMAQATGTRVPDWMAYRFEGLDDDVATRKLVGATVATELCAALYDQGVEDFHFYTLNRSDLTYAICHILGLRPEITETAEVQEAS